MKSMMLRALRDLGEVCKVLVVVGVPGALLLFHVWQEYQITQAGYAIAEVTQEHRDLLEEHKRLTVEATMHGRADRVALTAREQFGLEPARPEQIIVLDVQGGPEEHASLNPGAVFTR
ncbi:cell division protein FtsL [Lujinxingia litoralis]|nr:cell division protein FtsL [Lujinxingia litoralis]